MTESRYRESIWEIAVLEYPESIPNRQIKGRPRDCPCCERKAEEHQMSRHHILPQQKGGGKGKNIIRICNDCHKTIHQFFTNNQLKSKKNIWQVFNNFKMRNYREWIKKKKHGIVTNVTNVGGRKKWKKY